MLLVAAAVAAPIGSVPLPAAAGSTESIMVGGRARSFVLERPALQGSRQVIPYAGN
jgi:hypothetical protein